MSQEWLTLRAGTLVEARGDRWKIVEMVDHGTCASCRMVGAATSNIGLRRTLLVPFDRPRPVERDQQRPAEADIRCGGADHPARGARAVVDHLDDFPAVASGFHQGSGAESEPFLRHRIESRWHYQQHDDCRWHPGPPRLRVSRPESGDPIGDIARHARQSAIATARSSAIDRPLIVPPSSLRDFGVAGSSDSVSYTHLTLPTNREV